MATTQRPVHDVLTRLAAMDFLQIGPTTLWRLQVDGRLPYVRIGRRVVFRREDLEAFLQRNRRVG